MEDKLDVAIIGAGPCGLLCAYKLKKEKPELKIAVIEKGQALERRKCPAIEKKTKCMHCKVCSIMNGISGAGAFSDGKFPITNEFGGYLWEKIGKEKSLDLQNEVDRLNKELFLKAGCEEKDWPKLYCSEDTPYKKICTQHNLHLLDARIRHIGTDKGKIVYNQLYKELIEMGVEFRLDAEVTSLMHNPDVNEKDKFPFWIKFEWNNLKLRVESSIFAKNVVVATGRSGNDFIKSVCKEFSISTTSNKVDIGIRFECPDEIWSHITEDLYESKIVYKTETYEDEVRTFCMNPSGFVVNENTNGLVTVNGHAFEDKNKKSHNTNFALLVSQRFTEPFNDSKGYGEAIVKLSNMLGGGVIVQRYGDLIRGKRTTKSRLERNSVIPTLNAEPGDLSLAMPKRILDDIIEMIKKLDHLVPGMTNDDNLLFGIEVKFYNQTTELTENFNPVKIEDASHKKIPVDGLFIGGDGSGWTHSLSQASANGLAIAEAILKH